ncbi:MAG: HhH-GPD-type base excision DNA repair protein [Janthinobacterium lividum]
MTTKEANRAPHELWITGDPDADHLLTTSGNALLIGMVLDQQVPMEKAFNGPYVIATRMGGTFDVPAIAALEVDDFVAVCAEKPAVHRFPGSMGKRVHEVARRLVEERDGDAVHLWEDVADGATLKQEISALPGFGAQKASIMVALLGKRWGVQPAGWREAAGAYGNEGEFRSVADVVDAGSLLKVRAFKKQVKAAAGAG